MANNNTKAKRRKLAKQIGQARQERKRREAEVAKRKAEEAETVSMEAINETA